jgi:hypothetical protein
MVDVGLFTSGTPNEKPWLNLVSNSLTTNTIVANTITTSVQYSAGQVQTVSSATFNPTPAQCVNGIIGVTTVGGFTLTMPTGAALDAFVDQKSVSFKTVVCFSLNTVTAAAVSYNGLTSFDSQSGLTFSLNHLIPSATFYYFRDPVAGWTIYPDYSLHP